MVLRCVFKNKANYGRYFYMCYAAGSKMGQTCGQFSWVDMEQKLGLVSPPGVTAAGGADSEKMEPEGVQTQQRESSSTTSTCTNTSTLFDTTTEIEERVKHSRSSSPSSEGTHEHNDNHQGSDLNLAEELQDDDAALLEQQWEDIGDTDDLTLD